MKSRRFTRLPPQADDYNLPHVEKNAGKIGSRMSHMGHEHASEAALGPSAHCSTPDQGADGRDRGLVPEAVVPDRSM
jgi:hypothetical protein